MQSSHQMDDGHRRLVFVAAALFALSFVVAPLERTDATAARAPTSTEVSGKFTGEITADGPVYRLPPLHVVADSKTGYARIDHEEQRERARAAQARSAEQKPGV